MLRIKWSREDLRHLIELRLNEVFKDQYTKRAVKFDDIFTSKIGDTDPLSYMLDRSFYRPRDLIAYVNQCFEEADPGSSSISAKVVRQAEATYSNRRFVAIADEWREAYGDLEMALEALADLEGRFTFADLTDDFFENICLQLVAGDGHQNGRFATICNGIVRNEHPTYGHLRRMFVETMYIVGAIGIKRNSGAKFEWSYKDEPVLNFNLVNAETRFAIHPMLHRKLNIRADGSTFNA